MLIKRNKKDRDSVANLQHDRNMLLHAGSSFAVREAYKTLRTNLTFSITTPGCRLIGVTSASASEGKSTNCMNMAITFAENDAHVLVIDCDMRRPNVARLVGCHSIPGLSNLLVGVTTLDDAVHRNIFPGVDILPSGDLPPNPTELLDSERMQALLDKLSEYYDYILLDMPPINVVADALILSKHLTGVVFVVRQGISERTPVSEALKHLEFAGAKVLGFIMNDIPTSRHGKYGKYGKYSKYSYQYSSYEE